MTVKSMVPIWGFGGSIKIHSYCGHPALYTSKISPFLFKLLFENKIETRKILTEGAASEVATKQAMHKSATRAVNFSMISVWAVSL